MAAQLAAEALVVDLGAARVLDGLSLTVHAGEVLGVFGPSGAGKSTLFRALAGNERVTSGRVIWDGADITKEPLFRRARRGLGYLPQTPSVLFDLSIAENLRSFAALGAAFSLPRAEALVEELGLGARRDVRASALSGGERRRLELVRALAAEPRALLCDEPFAALDPAGKQAVGQRLKALANTGAAIVLADHDVREALPLCDRAVLLLAGAIATEGAPAAFSVDPLVRAHYVALPNLA